MQPAKKKFRAAALKSGYSSATKRARDASSSSPHSPSSSSFHSSSSKITPRGKRQRKKSGSLLTPDMSDSIMVTRKSKFLRPSIFLDLPEELLLDILSFFVSPRSLDMDNFYNIQLADKRFHNLINSPFLWKSIPFRLSDGSLNINTLVLIKQKSKGTEGTCYHVRRRTDNADIALKRARVYPDNEGVPYYMMRELAALKKISHPNICAPTLVSLKSSKLYLLFPYVEKTLHDILNPSGDTSTPRAEMLLKKHQVKNIMYQVCAAVAHIHDKGILHRNLKPKHLLIIPGKGLDPLDGAQVKLADFALVRVLRHPPKKLTSEVITLWYRPPEILMGQRDYSAAVDVWSIGCIFAELLQGKALFAGLCEIDQLFQIFQILGTPNCSVWPDFTSLPHYQSAIFPSWDTFRLAKVVSHANKTEFDFLAKCLQYNPLKRISAVECLKHAYFKNHQPLELLNSSPSSSSSSSSSSKRSTTMPQSSMRSAADTSLCTQSVEKYHASDLVNLHKTTLRQYSFLRELEADRRILETSSALLCDPSWNAELRGKVASWVIEVTSTFDSVVTFQRTAFFAIALLDAYYAEYQEIIKVVHENVGVTALRFMPCSMEMVVVCCLHIASKCEDVSYIGIRDLAYSFNGASDAGEYLVVEEEVLNTFQFDLYIPTVFDFLGLYLDCIPELNDALELQCLCQYLGMSILLSTQFCAFEPSRIATAIASYALSYCVDGTKNREAEDHWPSSLATLSQFKPYDLVACTQQLQEMQRQAILSSTPNLVFQHYGSSRNFSVALWMPH